MAMKCNKCNGKMIYTVGYICNNNPNHQNFAGEKDFTIIHFTNEEIAEMQRILLIHNLYHVIGFNKISITKN